MNFSPNYSIKDILEEFLITENISDRSLAQNIGLKNSQISRYRAGVLPEFPAAIKIANYFHCSLSYLFGLQDKFEKQAAPLVFDKQGFYAKYENLLKENKITHYQLCKRIPICETSLRLWKKGTFPSTSAILEISNFFGVSVDFLVCKIV